MNDTDTTVDSLLNGQIILRQPARGYRAGIDSVLLAAAITSEDGREVADLGVGAAAAALCLARREPMVRITGYEISNPVANVARENVASNGFEGRVTIAVADILDSRKLPDSSFDQVMSNPPFHLAGKGTESPYQSREQSARIGAQEIVTWVRSTAKILRPGGCATFVFAVERLELLLEAMSPRFGDLQVYPFWKRRGAPAKRAIVRARKGSGGPMQILPGMALHETDGSFTDTAEAVLRHGQGIRIGTNA